MNKGWKDGKGLKGDERGVTLVELIVVIAVFAVVGGASVGFFVSTYTGRAKAHARAELQGQVRFAAARVAYEIRRARGFEAASDYGVNLASVPGTLDLDIEDVADDPTTFDVSAGVLRMSQGAGPFVALTSDEVTVTDFTVDDRTSGNGRSRNLKVTLTARIQDPTGTTALDYSYTVTTAAEARDR